MPYGKIVGVHGRNISISVQVSTNTQGKVVDGNELERFHAEVMLPAANLRDIDYAVHYLGDATLFRVHSGKVFFPSAYGEPKMIDPGRQSEFDGWTCDCDGADSSSPEHQKKAHP